MDDIFDERIVVIGTDLPVVGADSFGATVFQPLAQLTKRFHG